MMNADFDTMLALKKVLESASYGMGMSQSVARELGTVRTIGSESARLVLLGYPLHEAMSPLVESGSEEVSMLASLIVSVPRSSSVMVGKSGGILADTLDRWVKTKESEKLQQKALRFRSLITCGVLGAVSAMVRLWAAWISRVRPCRVALRLSSMPRPGSPVLAPVCSASSCPVEGSTSMRPWRLGCSL